MNRNKSPEVVNHAPIAVSPSAAARMLGVGRTRVFGLMNDGELPRVKIGRSTVIPVEALRGFLARRVAEQQRGAA